MANFSRRNFLRATAFGAAAQLVGQGHTAQEPPRRRPNLDFMFSDQHAWDVMSCSGNRQIVTPNMDALYAEGIRFTHCFESAPVCTAFAKKRKVLTELTEDWMRRLDDPFIACQQLYDSAIAWAYPEAGGAINRISPIKWARRQRLKPVRLRRA